jgi:hypothetical protein
MFDLNQILSAALNAAVAEAVAPLVERIAVLERRIDTLSSQHVAIGERLAALENNPAQGVDTTLTNRVVALEQRMDHVIDASDERIREIAEAAAEQVMEDHTSTYDHDEYDSHISDDDKHFEGDLDDAINRALRHASVSISI